MNLPHEKTLHCHYVSSPESDGVLKQAIDDDIHIVDTRVHKTPT